MKRKYIIEHWWVVDEVDGTLSEVKRGTYSTYATSEAKAISNVRYRLGISLCPYDMGCDRAGWNELRVVSQCVSFMQGANPCPHVDILRVPILRGEKQTDESINSL